MKNIYSNIFSFNKKTLGKSIANLKKGNVIGLPTETVYGLGGNAYSKKAIQKIFNLKKRPKKNPLIMPPEFYELPRPADANEIVKKEEQAANTNRGGIEVNKYSM